MLDIKYLRQNIDLVTAKMRERGQEVNLERFVALDAGGGTSSRRIEGIRSERNTVSKQVGEKKKKQGRRHGAHRPHGEVSNRIKELDEALKQVDEELQSI